MNHYKMSSAYHNDPMFANMVNMMVHYLETSDFSPSEMRGMATFACTIFEERKSNPVFVITTESITGKTEEPRFACRDCGYKFDNLNGRKLKEFACKKCGGDDIVANRDIKAGEVFEMEV